MNDYTSKYELKYELLDEIGRGGFGRVYKAKLKGKDEYRAIKIIDKNKIKAALRSKHEKQNVEAEYVHYNKDLKDEIRAMEICQKNNKNSVKYYEYYDNDDEFVIVMELCDENLFDLIKRTKKIFSLDEIYNMLSQLNNTFKIMHKNNIAHRDLKLENILIKYENKEKTKFTYKLTDYGISKRFRSLSQRFSTKMAGTLGYMAPEILAKEEYGYESDMWSLGIIIYMLFFGRNPYNGETVNAILNQIQKQKQRHFKSSKDGDFDNLIKELLIVEPKERLTWVNYFNHPFFVKRQQLYPIVKETPLSNEINLLLRIGELEKSKNIYFIENPQYRIIDEQENKDINNLNDTNTKIFIDDKKITFNKCFAPTEAKDYKIKIKFKNKIKDCSYMFRGCGNIISIDLSSFDSSEVIDMKQMFSICSGLKEVNLKNLNVAKVKDMSYMFNKCFEIEKITIPSSFDTQNVENMSFMFHFCQFLKEISFPASFKTNKVRAMIGMFGKCYNLKQLDLKNFDTGAVTNMSFMFDQCRNLEELLIIKSRFKTNAVENMGHMFNECNKLKLIDLSNFNTEKNQFFCSMFENCSQLKTLDLSHFTVSRGANIENMFEGCSNLDNSILSSLVIPNDYNAKNMLEYINNIRANRENTNYDDEFIGQYYDGQYDDQYDEQNDGQYDGQFDTSTTSYTSN